MAAGMTNGFWAAFTRLAVRRPVLIAAVFFVCLWGVLAVAEESATAPAVLNVRVGVDAEGQTRVVFDTDARPDFVLTALPDARLAVTIRGAAFVAAGGEGAGLAPNWLADGETARLRLSEPALPVRSFVMRPNGDTPHYRLVIDLGAVAPEAYAAVAEAEAVPAAMPLTAPRATPDAMPGATPDATSGADTRRASAIPQPSIKPRAPAPKPPAAARAARSGRTVVIDPGHGGYDPGASGASGLREEAATLAAARALRTILQARGYTVVLTRDEDSFVALGERVEIARRAHADLFLSLHADAHEDPGLRGASVYTLSDQRAGRMAHEMKSGGDFVLYDVALSEEERDVGDILFDIASAETRNASGRLAATLVSELSGRVPMVNNTHRKGSLAVLLSPDVPAVLVEMAFISNPDDEANLGSERWRRRTMTTLADGIDAYFGERVAAVDEDGAADG